MRMLFGMIVGAALTVGSAYVRDSSATADTRPMVNWDVVNATARNVMAVATDQWNRLTAK